MSMTIQDYAEQILIPSAIKCVREDLKAIEQYMINRPYLAKRRHKLIKKITELQIRCFNKA
jgi:hypothetical protein